MRLRVAGRLETAVVTRNIKRRSMLCVPLFMLMLDDLQTDWWDLQTVGKLEIERLRLLIEVLGLVRLLIYNVNGI